MNTNINLYYWKIGAEKNQFINIKWRGENKNITLVPDAGNESTTTKALIDFSELLSSGSQLARQLLMAQLLLHSDVKPRWCQVIHSAKRR
jgi:hypothetical protein